mmetsp:Transcript_26819/g.30990  ORF Transcript_26819/g.30990 Transcript_26819/m.30990 type:complete len:225 (-) Transcript_26819:174-848(-)
MCVCTKPPNYSTLCTGLVRLKNETPVWAHQQRSSGMSTRPLPRDTDDRTNPRLWHSSTHTGGDDHRIGVDHGPVAQPDPRYNGSILVRPSTQFLHRSTDQLRTLLHRRVQEGRRELRRVHLRRPTGQWCAFPTVDPGECIRIRRIGRSSVRAFLFDIDLERRQITERFQSKLLRQHLVQTEGRSVQPFGRRAIPPRFRKEGLSIEKPTVESSRGAGDIAAAVST